MAEQRKHHTALTISIAVACFVIAGILIVQAGLPARAAFIGQINPGGQLIAPAVGAFAPDFERETLAGAPLRLSDLRGSPVVLNFWATWCVPCRAEMTELQMLYDDYAKSSLHIVAINLGETREIAVQWVEAMGLTFDIVLDESDSLRADYYLPGQPATFVVAPSGIITHLYYGPVTRSQLEAALAPFFTVNHSAYGKQ